MSTETDTEQKAVAINLIRHGTLTNDPCALCGARCDPCGLDFVLGDTLCALIETRGSDLQGWRAAERERRMSVDHFIGVCLLCLKPGTLIHIRGMGFYYCETDRAFWDESCDRIAFQYGHEYDKAESDKNTALIADYFYIEPAVEKAFNAIREAAGIKDYGPASDDVEIEHKAHTADCAIRHHGMTAVCTCGAVSWFEVMPRKDYEAMLPPKVEPQPISDDLPF